MNRRVWCGSLATTAAWVGFASAQAPPADSSPTADGPVFVMKTAGQPERRVKVIRTEKLPDGSSLTDVKDLASGVVYTLTNPAVLGTAVATAAAPAPKPAPVAANVPTTTGTVAAAPAPAPQSWGTPRPLFGSFPNQPQTTAKTTPPAPTPKATTVAAGAPRPLFGSFPNQPQPKTAAPDLRTAAGERLIPTDAAPPAEGTAGLPQARTRKTDPLLAGASTSPAAITARTPFAIPPGSPPSVLGKILGEPEHEQPQPRVGVLPPPVLAQENLNTPPTMLPPPTTVAVKSVAPPPAAVAKAVPPKPVETVAVAKPAEPVAVAVAKPAEKVGTTDGGLAVPSIDPNAKPTAATGIFDSQPAAMVQASGTEKAAVLIPPIDAGATGPVRVLPPIAGTPDVVETPPAAVLPPAVTPPVVEPAPAVPAVAVPVPAAEPVPRLVPPAVVDVPAAVIEPPAVEVPRAAAAGVLPADVQAMIEGLKTHRRPSYRMENATALAESAYARHPDVLSALMQAARSDATGVVRGHCIGQLAAVGYADATYVQLLDTWTNDGEPAVRRAAVAAKQKATGR